MDVVYVWDICFVQLGQYFMFPTLANRSDARVRAKEQEQAEKRSPSPSSSSSSSSQNLTTTTTTTIHRQDLHKVVE